MVKVECGCGALTYHNNRAVDEILTIKAMNFGDKPVTLSSFGITTNDGTLHLNQHPGCEHLPKRLEHGEAYTGIVDLSGVVNSLTGKQFRYAWFLDQLGREYRTDEKDSNEMNRFLNEYRMK